MNLMMPLSPHAVEAKLAAQQPYAKVYVAYSGGVDSHVLLHLCVAMGGLKDRITAVYINHGLQLDAESWALHCEQTCANLGVGFTSLRVNAVAKTGESPEEAARSARYAALKALLADDDLLLLAQHGEDQLETVLLQLFRGSGLKGLSGMPDAMPFGKGKLLRPLLAADKVSIISYADAHALKWVEDPSNQQNQFDRNFLRNAIIPLLKQRWPALDKTVPRSALHCANAQNLLSPLAQDLLDTVLIPGDDTLDIGRLQSHSGLQQQLLVRQWFHHLGLKMPTQATLERILLEIVAAKTAANPVLATQGREFRRYRGKLYCLKPVPQEAGGNWVWPVGDAMFTIPGVAYYELIRSPDGISCELWHKAHVTVRFRSGGETIQLPSRIGHHSLKNLYQEAGIPPWERLATPLVYLDGKFAAVGDYWISDEFYQQAGQACYRIVRRKINPKGNDDTAIVD